MTLLAFATPVRIARAAAVTGCAGLLTAACSGPAARPHADSQPSSRPLSPGAAASSHAAPRTLPSTTPAAISPAPHAASPSAPLTSAPVTVPVTSAPVTSAPVTSAPPGGSPAPLAQCSTGALRVSVGPPGNAAGSLYYPLDFANVSGSPCSMYGYPGVSFVSAPGGGQVGATAVRDAAAEPSLVVLPPGAVAHAGIQVLVAQNYPRSACKPVTAHWLRVYPPGQYAPSYAELTAATCTRPVSGGSTLGIFVVRPGANGS